jgi:hypothetical protein
LLATARVAGVPDLNPALAAAVAEHCLPLPPSRTRRGQRRRSSGSEKDVKDGTAARVLSWKAENVERARGSSEGPARSNIHPTCSAVRVGPRRSTSDGPKSLTSHFSPEASTEVRH